MKPAERKRRWASLSAGAEYLDCSPRTLRNYISEGLIPGYYIGNRKSLKVDLNELDQLPRRVPAARGGN